MKKAVKAILNVLSYGGIEVESARRLADIKKLDPIRIFLRKLDMEIYNGDYKVPIRLFFPDEKMEEHGAKEAIATVYKGNIIKNLIMDCQSYTKYRPNETTGGIFVSWRRKEELPTGA